MAAIEQRIRKSKEKLDSNSYELLNVFHDLSIPVDRHIDKGYHMSQDEVLGLIEEENPDRRKVGLAYYNYTLHHDPKLLKEGDHYQIYVSLYANTKKIIEQVINEFDCEKEKFEGIIHEYLMSVHILCKVSTLEFYYTSLFEKEESQKLLAELFQYLNSKDETVNRDYEAKRGRCLVDLHGHDVLVCPFCVPSYVQRPPDDQ
jgi:hypothetical protein